MSPLRIASIRSIGGRCLPWAVVGLAGAVPATVAASMVVDLIQKRGRKTRAAPRPGTFNAMVEESELNIYTDGSTLYEAMIDAIDSARESILMETFIWKNDEVGQRFIDAFNAAADRGVEIHLIYDGFANLTVPCVLLPTAVGTDPDPAPARSR